MDEFDKMAQEFNQHTCGTLTETLQGDLAHCLRTFCDALDKRAARAGFHARMDWKGGFEEWYAEYRINSRRVLRI